MSRVGYRYSLNTRRLYPRHHVSWRVPASIDTAHQDRTRRETQTHILPIFSSIRLGAAGSRQAFPAVVLLAMLPFCDYRSYVSFAGGV